MIDPNQHDRFVVTRQRRMAASPSLGSVDHYEFRLADADADTPPICFVHQRVSHATDRIGFYADEARTEAVMHLNMGPRFDPWKRFKLTDAGTHTIGEIQKEFTARRRRSHYVLYDRHGEALGRVEAHVPAAVGRRRAGGIVVVAAAGVLGIPIIGAAGVAAVVPLAAAAAIRQVRDCVDPIDVASQLRIVRGDETLGIFVRRPLAGTTATGTSTLPLPWKSPASVYEIDMSSDPSKTADRRLVLAVPVALDALRGIFAE
jgi:uncharacterized protein YxjI